MKTKFILSVFVVGVFTSCSSKNKATESFVTPDSTVIHTSEERADHQTAEAIGTQYAISTAGVYATQAAKEILDKGGNIIDAMVATSFVLTVERPQSTGLTGGGFMLFREAKTGKTYAVDFRERAPLKATENMFIGADGKPDKNLSRNDVLATAVPGLVAGLWDIYKKFGKLPWAMLVQPAIRLAENGFPVYAQLNKAIEARLNVLSADVAAREIFLNSEGKPWPVGHILVQKDLANTLRLISMNGKNGFYTGPVANNIVELFKNKKGLITKKDLQSYKVHWRQPVKGRFHDYELYSMPPPSSGGVHVIQFLNTLENDELARKGFLTTSAVHLAASALQSAFADRARYLGDPDFVHVPVKGLTSKAYATRRRSEIPEDHARQADEVMPGDPLPYESTETTHFSMMDAAGNAVSSTQTINGWMGSGIVVPKTGMLLNNEMDDFSAQEGASNMFGAIGGKPDAIAPRKTPLSSMSPTILLREGKVQMAVGAPGGTRIISCVAQTILNAVEYKLPLYDAIAAVRYHHQWRPDVLLFDPPGPSTSELEKLKKMGYKIEIKPTGCTVMAVMRESGDKLHAVADPRDIGTSAAR